MNENRKRVISKGKVIKGPVLYWMSQYQRVNDNRALIYAQKIALKKTPLIMIFCLVPKFLSARFRQYDFMFSGLKEAQYNLDYLNISFILLQGIPLEVIPNFIKEYHIAVLINYFSPLRIKKNG